MEIQAYYILLCAVMQLNYMAGQARIELATNGLTDRRSTSELLAITRLPVIFYNAEFDFK